MKVIDQVHRPSWSAYNADSVELLRELPDESIGYSIFSPPFASLYVYSASSRDLGNCGSHSEFYEHFKFMVGELLRVTKPGRLLSMHVMNLPTSKARDGYIGITDFRGILIRLFQEAGWIYHSEVCIFKDPVTAMQRTHALGLLHKQIRKDSCMSRQGIADWLITLMRPTNDNGGRLLDDCYTTDLVTMRKPGENPEPVSHTGKDDDLPVELWQRYASPIWVLSSPTPAVVQRSKSGPYMTPENELAFATLKQDINPSDTLQYRSAREEADERHICPLQLEVIRRGIDLWSKPGDTVLSPFGGIGSEGVIALEMGRKSISSELKPSYYRQNIANHSAAEPNATGKQIDMFASPQSSTNIISTPEAAE